MQNITIIGNLGADAEVKTINGKEYTAFNIGCTRKIKNDSVTTWYSCFKYGTNDNLRQYLTKGAKVAVSGEFSQRNSESNGRTYINNNINVSTLELVGSKQDNAPKKEAEPKQPTESSAPLEIEDDLPF